MFVSFYLWPVSETNSNTSHTIRQTREMIRNLELIVTRPDTRPIDTSCGRVGRGGNACFHNFQLDHHGPTKGRTSGRRDQRKMHWVGWHMTQGELGYSFSLQTVAEWKTHESNWPSPLRIAESAMPEMQWRIFTDFDMKFFWRWNNIDFRIFWWEMQQNFRSQAVVLLRGRYMSKLSRDGRGL